MLAAEMLRPDVGGRCVELLGSLRWAGRSGLLACTKKGLGLPKQI